MTVEVPVLVIVGVVSSITCFGGILIGMGLTFYIGSRAARKVASQK